MARDGKSACVVCLMKNGKKTKREFLGKKMRKENEEMQSSEADYSFLFSPKEGKKDYRVHFTQLAGGCYPGPMTPVAGLCGVTVVSQLDAGTTAPLSNS